jgi:hypothetical protein
MNQIGKSYENVHYEFRPAKQVERRMLIHTFQCLMAAGFPINDYKYTGLGSIYFVDFILFHRYLGIENFLSVESSTEIVRRVRFNQPYSCVEIAIGDIAEFIPSLSTEIQHILWLDFDHILTNDMLDAVHLAATQLSCGSILLVTVDVEPPGGPEDGLSKWNPKTWRKYFIEEGKNYIWARTPISDFGRQRLPKVNARLIETAISKGILGRSDVSFIPLFNFIYADGHRMLSVGGMIGTGVERQKLSSLNRRTLYFLKPSLTEEPYEIIVPKITRKERLYLDSMMPCRDDWNPDAFELEREKVLAYRSIYRYYPAYTEMLL